MRVDLASISVGVVLAVALSACGGGGSNTSDAEMIASGESVSSSVEGSIAYLHRCGGCHGVVGSEQAQRSLSTIDQLSREDIDAKIRNGGPQMPGFETSLTSAEISAIIDHIIENR